MPFDSTPRSLPRRISLPPGSRLLCSAAGTRSPSFKLLAPVTICTGCASPTSTWHTTMWSESGCGTMDKMRPTTTFLISSASHAYVSTLLPLMVMRSAYSCGVQSILANSFAQPKGIFIVVSPPVRQNCFKKRRSFSYSRRMSSMP